jgi:hypothetical protein
MKTIQKISKALILKGLAFTLLFGAISCSDNEDIENFEESNASKSSFYITDAPTDNANVSGVIVTVTDLRVNNVSVNNFTRTTIDLMQYQNGLKKILGDLELNAGTYSNIELVLDNEFDASGNAPGSYVKLTNGTKDALSAAATSTIAINKTFEILSGGSDIVLDFDVRKAIVSNGGDFQFVTDGELRNSIRVVNEEKSGEISGMLTNQNSSEMIIVYAYEKGTFDANTETSGQGSSNVMFANAVNSSVVSEFSGSYELNFLKEGDYELHFISYSDDNNDGEFEFKAILEIESNSNIDLGNISITSNSSVNLVTSVAGSL